MQYSGTKKAGSYSKVAARILIRGVVVILFLWVMVKVPGFFAAETTAPFQGFRANKLPSQQQLRQTYTNFTILMRRDGTFNRRKVEDVLVPITKEFETYLMWNT